MGNLPRRVCSLDIDRRSRIVRTTLTVRWPMQTKLAKLKAAAFANDWPLALRIAARFPRLGDDATAIRRANDCLTGRASIAR